MIGGRTALVWGCPILRCGAGGAGWMSTVRVIILVGAGAAHERRALGGRPTTRTSGTKVGRTKSPEPNLTESVSCRRLTAHERRVSV